MSDFTQEIEDLSAQFLALGANPHRACMTWIGKPNSMTGVMMTSPLEVLTYLQEIQKALQRTDTEEAQEPAAQQVAAVPLQTHDAGDQGAPQREDAPLPVPAQPLALPIAPSSDYAVWQRQCDEANTAWRDAIRRRGHVLAQLDSEVRQAHARFVALRACRPAKPRKPAPVASV